MSGGIIKHWNGSAFAEFYPKTTTGQIVAGGTPSSSTFLRGDGNWATPVVPAHNLIDTTGHPVSGLTSGHFLKATGATTYAFGAHGLTNTDVGAAATSHAHGAITNTGYLGSTANIPLITGTSGVIQAGSFGTAANTFCQGNDSRLSDARTPTSHTHGNITNAGYIGTTASLPIITGTGGILQAGSFGTAAATFCQGNDARLSDARTPTAHTQTVSTISDATTVGQNFVKLTNPSALSYPKISATNTVSTLTPAQVLADIGGISMLKSYATGDTLVYDTTYTSTGLSLSLDANSYYLVRFVGGWSRLSGSTAHSYRLSLVATATALTGAYAVGKFEFSSLATTTAETVATYNSLSATPGGTYNTMVTASATTAVTDAPIVFEAMVHTPTSYSMTMTLQESVSTTIVNGSGLSAGSLLHAFKIA